MNYKLFSKILNLNLINDNEDKRIRHILIITHTITMICTEKEIIKS
jgi:hypothetical protein